MWSSKKIENVLGSYIIASIIWIDHVLKKLNIAHKNDGFHETVEAKFTLIYKSSLKI